MKRHSLYCYLCLLPLVLALSTTKKSLALCCSTHNNQVLQREVSEILSPLHAKQSQLSQALLISLMLQPLNHLCGLLLGSLQYVHISLVVVEPRTGHSSLDVASPVLSAGDNHLSLPALPLQCLSWYSPGYSADTVQPTVY